MSCLWQSSKITGFCHKKDIMRVNATSRSKLNTGVLAHMCAWQSRNKDAQMIGEN